MPLRLQIISERPYQREARTEITFGPIGGTIGRSVDNDWVLPDPNRYVSAHHARIQCHAGSFFLEDLSTNGVYVNGAEQPLGRGMPYELRHGDVLRLGEYHISVALDATASLPVDDFDVLIDIPDQATALPTSIRALRPVGVPIEGDLGASLDLEEIFGAGGSPYESLMPASGSYTQPAALSAAAGQAISDTGNDAQVAARIAYFARAVAKRERGSAARAPASPKEQSGLEAFCRGAGITPEQLPPNAQALVMHLAGLLFREALLGLKDLERTRAEIRGRLGMEAELEEDESSRPSLPGSTIEDLLVEIFRQHESRRLDAVQWLRETMEAARDHDKAMVSAMRAAFADFVSRLDPAELAARFDRSASRSNKPPGDRSLYWDLYAEFYRNLTETPPEGLPHTFAEAFANAYREILKKSS